jgi:nitrate reductase gamma subunit
MNTLIELINNLAPSGKFLFYAIIPLLFLLLFIFLRFMKVIEAVVEKQGQGYLLLKIKHISVFGIMILVAVLVLGFLVFSFQNGNKIIDLLMFTVLPYLALGIYLIGSIFRYRSRGFQVSSLSSQFLEGRKLFWGSQPFHWGLLILFFGHLIAFLFPSSILAWNGKPLRLMILEGTGFAAALLVLFGLVLLIQRRLSSMKVLMVTNKMDLLVYIVLLVQVLSGIGTAYFVRWGSSWFASTLTPYLWSVLVFSPETAAVEALPWLIKVHIASAFIMIAIIPFTRFMHFLVAPLDYLWRSYQQVLWNWNRKEIRNSRAYFIGKRPGNN